MRGSPLERVVEQGAGARDIAAIKRRETFVHELFRCPLLLRLRAARTIDVGSRTIVRPIEKEDAGPQVDGGFEFTGEIVIEAGDQELFDSRIMFGAFGRLGGATAGR